MMWSTSIVEEFSMTDYVIDVEKYARALNNLIGMDSAYFNGDKDVDAIVELVTLAKKMENTIKHQRSEIKKLNDTLKIVRKVNGQLTEPNYVKSLKNDAIKEFAERLKVYRNKPEFPWDDYTVSATDIEELVEVMINNKKQANCDTCVHAERFSHEFPCNECEKAGRSKPTMYIAKGEYDAKD